MIDKIQKIREEVARIQLYTQSEVLKQILDYIDKVQEEPVSIWHDASEEPDQSKDLCAVYSNGKFDFFEHVEGKSYNNYWTAVNQARTEKGILLDKWAYLDDLLNLSNVERIGKNWKEPVSEDLEEEIDNYVKRNGYDGLDSIEEVKYIANHFAKWQKAKDKSMSDDLGEYINELSKQFPEVSFAKLSRIAVRVAKWHKAQFEKNRLKHCNSITNEQAELESVFIDQHLDKHQRMPTFLDAIEYGMRLQKEQMMAKAIDVEVKVDAGGYPYIDKTIELYDYDKDVPLAKKEDRYKVILIKED